MTNAGSIRNFKSAPVIETVLSIQFAPIKGFTIPHFGLYWQTIRTNYSHCEAKNPILHLVEDFTKTSSIQGLSFEHEIQSERALRYWFSSNSKNWILQLQQDRFILNWKSIGKDDVYPRYSEIRQKFMEEWKHFCSFLASEALASPEVDQCEVTYVNHIEYSAGWNSYGKLSKIVSYWSGEPSGNFLPPPDKVNINVRYGMHDNAGRLYVALQPVIRTGDVREVLQLNLTARGAPKSSRVEDIFGWLDVGREWVVQGFTDFTTKEMHREWGLE